MRSFLFSLRVALALVLTVPLLGLVTALAPAASIHRITQRWARIMVMLCGCRPVVAGLDCLPAGVSVVMTANHSSFLDSVILLAAIPGEYRFVVNHHAAGRPILGMIIRKVGHLVVNRRSVRSRVACARAMARILESGTSLIIFPEGTRSRGDLLPFRLGGFRVATKTSRMVVPVVIRGTGQMLPRDFKLLEPVRLSVQLLPAIAAAGVAVRFAADMRDRAHTAMAQAVPRV